MDNTIQYLQKVEPKLINIIQKTLDKDKRNASQRLRNSFEISIDKGTNSYLIKLTYAKHGAFVLDSNRNVVKAGPSKKAIDSIKQWIKNKAISVGGGSIRTPAPKTYTTPGGKYDLKPNTEAKRESLDNEITSFAFAIWHNIKKRGRTFTPPTNFLKPWETLGQQPAFRKGLTDALAKDGVQALTNPKQFKNLTIKIKV